jgi:hypothetical protein
MKIEETCRRLYIEYHIVDEWDGFDNGDDPNNDGTGPARPSLQSCVAPGITSAIRTSTPLLKTRYKNQDMSWLEQYSKLTIFSMKSQPAAIDE